MSRTIRSICVYCGSGAGDDPVFLQAATDLGRAMGANGVRLVYGGGNLGLMGAVARAAVESGGRVLGVIPEFLKTKERVRHFEEDDDGRTRLVVVPDMHTRKRMMFDEADAFVALPGGIGTLEELVEQMTWAQLGQHGKPILILDVGGFWRPLLDLLTHMREKGFIRAGFELRTLVAERVDQVLAMLEGAAGAAETAPALPPL